MVNSRKSLILKGEGYYYVDQGRFDWYKETGHYILYERECKIHGRGYQNFTYLRNREIENNAQLREGVCKYVVWNKSNNFWKAFQEVNSLIKKVDLKSILIQLLSPFLLLSKWLCFPDVIAVVDRQFFMQFKIIVSFFNFIFIYS